MKPLATDSTGLLRDCHVLSSALGDLHVFHCLELYAILHHRYDYQYFAFEKTCQERDLNNFPKVSLGKAEVIYMPAMEATSWGEKFLLLSVMF